MSFAQTFLGDENLTPTRKVLRLGSRSNLVSKGLLHAIYINQTILALDFHVFDTQDFDVLIGHPLEKLFS